MFKSNLIKYFIFPAILCAIAANVGGVAMSMLMGSKITFYNIIGGIVGGAVGGILSGAYIYNKKIKGQK